MAQFRWEASSGVQMANSSLYPHLVGDRQRKQTLVTHKGIDPIHETSPLHPRLIPIIAQILHLLLSLHWGVGFQHELGVHTFSPEHPDKKIPKYGGYDKVLLE